MLLGRKDTENKCICGKIHKRYSRGNLLSKNVTAETNLQVSTLYSGTKSRKYCVMWHEKKNLENNSTSSKYISFCDTQCTCMSLPFDR